MHALAYTHTQTEQLITATTKNDRTKSMLCEWLQDKKRKLFFRFMSSVFVMLA